MLVVLGLLALVLAVVPPFLPGAVAGAQVKGAVRELTAALKYARGLAVSAQEEKTMTVNVHKKSYTVDKRARRLDLPATAGLTLTTATTERLSDAEGSIRFFPDGSSTGGQLRLRHGGADYRIEVNWLTGRVSIAP